MQWHIEQIQATDSQRIESAFLIFSVLRPHLNLSDFIAQLEIQFSEGYQLIAIYDGDVCLAAAGFRFAHFLAWGKVMYIDDLITHPDFKRQGLASALLDELGERAVSAQCNQIHLDSGYQRLDAHRLYLNKGFTLASHHFSKLIP